MSNILLCILGSLGFSSVELLSERKSFRATLFSPKMWLLVFVFVVVNALFANIMSYLVYKTNIIINSQCNTTFSEFIKNMPDGLKYFLGGLILYPALVNLKITEIVSDAGKMDIGIATIYNTIKDFIITTIDGISVDCKYQEAEKYLEKNQKTFEQLYNEAETKTLSSNKMYNDSEKKVILDKLKKLRDELSQNHNPTTEHDYKMNIAYLILFNEMLDKS